MPTKKPAWKAAGRLDKLLEDLEISNVELARRLGMKDAAISRWRSGSRAPSPDRLAEICRATGLSADEILGLDADREWPSHEAARARRLLAAVAEAMGGKKR